MLKWTEKVMRVLNTKQMMKFGGHNCNLVDTEYNPDKVNVHKDDITPEQVEKYRDVFYENRPQDRSHSWTASYLDWFINSRLVRNQYLVGFMQNVIQDQSITEMRTSTYINPPKLHDNSIFVCQAGQLGQSNILMRSFDGFLVGGTLLISVSPFFHELSLLIVFYLIANSKYYYPSKSLVIRMDLLPHLEQISVVRLGFNGQLYNKLYNLNTLQKIDYDQLNQTKNMLAKGIRKNYDINMIFQDSETQDYLLFDSQTIWNKEGLEHALISSRNH